MNNALNNDGGDKGTPAAPKQTDAVAKSLLALNKLSYEIPPDLNIAVKRVKRDFYCETSSMTLSNSLAPRITFQAGQDLIDPRYTTLEFVLDVDIAASWSPLVDDGEHTPLLPIAKIPTSEVEGVLESLASARAMCFEFMGGLNLINKIQMKTGSGSPVFEILRPGEIREHMRLTNEKIDVRAVDEGYINGGVVRDNVQDELEGYQRVRPSNFSSPESTTSRGAHIVGQSRTVAVQNWLAQGAPGADLVDGKDVTNQTAAAAQYDYSAFSQRAVGDWRAGKEVVFHLRTAFSINLAKLPGSCFFNRAQFLPSQLMSGAQLEIHWDDNLTSALKVSYKNSESISATRGVLKSTASGYTSGEVVEPSSKINLTGEVTNRQPMAALEDSCLATYEVPFWKQYNFTIKQKNAFVTALKVSTTTVELTPGLLMVIQNLSKKGKLRMMFPNYYRRVDHVDPFNQSSTTMLTIPATYQNALGVRTRFVPVLATDTSAAWNPLLRADRGLPPIVDEYQYNAGTFQFPLNPVKARTMGNFRDTYPLVQNMVEYGGSSGQLNTLGGVKMDEILPPAYRDWFDGGKQVNTYSPLIAQLPCNSLFNMTADFQRGGPGSMSGLALNASRGLTLSFKGMLNASPLSVPTGSTTARKPPIDHIQDHDINGVPLASTHAGIKIPGAPIMLHPEEFYLKENIQAVHVIEYMQYITVMLDRTAMSQ